MEKHKLSSHWFYSQQPLQLAAPSLSLKHMLSHSHQHPPKNPLLEGDPTCKTSSLFSPLEGCLVPLSNEFSFHSKARQLTCMWLVWFSPSTTPWSKVSARAEANEKTCRKGESIFRDTPDLPEQTLYGVLTEPLAHHQYAGCQEA